MSKILLEQSNSSTLAFGSAVIGTIVGTVGTTLFFLSLGHILAGPTFGVSLVFSLAATTIGAQNIYNLIKNYRGNKLFQKQITALSKQIADSNLQINNLILQIAELSLIKIGLSQILMQQLSFYFLYFLINQLAKKTRLKK